MSSTKIPGRAAADPKFIPLTDQIFLYSPETLTAAAGAAAAKGSSESDASSSADESTPLTAAVGDSGDGESDEGRAASSLRPEALPTDPEVVIIFGWGDCRLRHVAKFAHGYRALYPQARVYVVLAPIYQAMTYGRERAANAMLPLVHAAYSAPAAGAAADEKQRVGPDGHARANPRQTLIQVMSNTGGINFVSFLQAYRNVHGGDRAPHALTVLDSTPSGIVLTWSNLQRWSYAMAIGTAKFLPWPLAITQTLWAVFLLINAFVHWLLRRELVTVFSVNAVNSPAWVEPRVSRRLYCYGPGDEIIPADDIEAHATAARTVGFDVDLARFDGSNHVCHMREHPQQYWRAVRRAWAAAVADGRLDVEADGVAKSNGAAEGKDSSAHTNGNGAIAEPATNGAAAQ